MSNNITDADADGAPVQSYLKGAAWGDFRPRTDSALVNSGSANAIYLALDYVGSAPDIGAYKDGDTPWVPGHRHAVATNPVPFNGAENVAVELELMFKAAIGNSRIYLGTDVNRLSDMSGTLVSGLIPSTTYFWRVDTDGEAGEIWNFSTASE